VSGDHVYDVDCEKCGKKFWVNNGDTTDITVPDVVTARCPWCQANVCTIPIEFRENGDEDTSCGSNTVGHKTPNEAFGIA
jgi:hypothetical protein